ncbi:MAG: hypothetical protein RSA95_16360 [Citrobacter sp.]|uniref:hypothetical protein n=1 Tax=Citrobacter sp. TaxID=1896336 RepID=UPI002FC9CAB7
MSEMGGTLPIPAGRAGTFPRGMGGRLDGIIGIIQNLDAARGAYLERMAEMEKVKAEA